MGPMGENEAHSYFLLSEQEQLIYGQPADLTRSGSRPKSGDPVVQGKVLSDTINDSVKSSNNTSKRR